VPTVVGEAGSAIVTVTDAAGATASVTLGYGQVKAPPTTTTTAVTLPPSTTTTSSPTTTTATASAAKPSITKRSPASGTSRGGNTLTITGKDLSKVTKVEFVSAKYGTAKGTIKSKSATKLTVKVPSGMPGKVTVKVTSAAGTATTTYTYKQQFTDVKATTRYFKQIYSLYNLKVAAGRTATKFYPAKSITRQELQRMVAKVATLKLAAKYTVKSADYKKTLTRAQMISRIVKSVKAKAKLKTPPKSYTPPFTKAQVGATYYADLRIAAYNKLLDGLNGYAAKKLSFKAKAQRGEAAVVIYNLLRLKGKVK